MWIKLHSFFKPDEEMNVQVENICTVYRDDRDDMRDATVIQFAGSSGNYINVKETPKEVMGKIALVNNANRSWWDDGK